MTDINQEILAAVAVVKTRPSVLGNLKVFGLTWKKVKTDARARSIWVERFESLPQVLGWGKETQSMLAMEHQFADWWLDAGSVVFELTHDMAAMFALTTAVDIDWNFTPHAAFVVKVPRSLLPIEGSFPSDDTWLLVANRGALIVADHDTTADQFISFGSGITYGSEIEKVLPTRQALLAGRYISNLISYLQVYRDRIESKGRYSKNVRATFLVRPPRDVVVSREFRDAARDAVKADSLMGIRRALAHVVRGHWRNQPVGEGRQERRLTWVRPHRRGDESLGRVVQRIERITESRE